MSDESIKKVLLMIADIGGYTEFMVSTDLEIEHSQKIITQLISTIIEKINIPLEISKLEGDKWPTKYYLLMMIKALLRL